MKGFLTALLLAPFVALHAADGPQKTLPIPGEVFLVRFVPAGIAIAKAKAWTKATNLRR